MKITAVILAKDEESTVGEVVQGALPRADRVIVVDGHSSDGTVKAAELAGAQVVSDNGLGKGDGYRKGIEVAGRDGVIVFLDADGSHDPADIPKLAKPIMDGGADMVVASRWKGGSDDIDASFSSFIRNIGGNFITVLIAWRFGATVTDALNGYRALNAARAHELVLKANDFDIEQEMIVSALKKGWRVGEVASHEYARKGGMSKLPTYRKFYLFFWRLLVNMF